MTDIQTVLLNLMKEIDATCKKNEIPYFLFESTLLQAVRSGGFEEDACDACVAIKAEDCLRFITAITDNMDDSRYLESINNNPDYRFFCLEYGAADTLDFNLLNWKYYVNHGIKVLIYILRYDNDSFSGKYDRVFERAWKNKAPNKNSKFSSKLLYRHAEKVIRKSGKSEYGKVLFKRLIDSGSKTSNKIYINKRFRSGRFEFDASLFNKQEEIIFEGIPFSAPLLYETILNTIYGVDWKEEPVKNRNFVNRLIDVDLPFKEYLDALKNSGSDIDLLWKSIRQYESERKEFRTVNKKVQSVWHNLFFAGDRINLYEYYSGLKPKLAELYDARDKEGLRLLLTPYYEAAKEYLQSDLGLYFDETVFGYLKYVYGDEDPEFINDLTRNIPSQLDVPISIYTYDGNIDVNYLKEG